MLNEKSKRKTFLRFCHDILAVFLILYFIITFTIWVMNIRLSDNTLHTYWLNWGIRVPDGQRNTNRIQALLSMAMALDITYLKIRSIQNSI